MNKDIFEGKFKEISGEIKKKWGQLTDDEIRESKGNAQALAGIIQQKYGKKKEDVEREVSEAVGDLERKFSGKKVSKGLNEKVERLKDKLKKS